MKNKSTIELNSGGGGIDSDNFFAAIRKMFPQFGCWQKQSDDAAVLKWGQKKLVFTTDSYTVTPLFFGGGNIGKLAICGTINDLAVMGAQSLGISLSLVIEEGFPRGDLDKILRSIARVSKQQRVPVVTGDTKVMEKGKIDKLIINTSGVGVADKIIANAGLRSGQVLIASGSLGDHGGALLACRFGYDTKLRSDCQSIWPAVKFVRKYLTAAKDPTRGGLAGILNEMAGKAKVKIIIKETAVPVKKETAALSEILGISVYDLACEGRFVAGVTAAQAPRVLRQLRKFDKQAAIIGKVVSGRGVFIRNNYGLRPLRPGVGKLVPRIC
jgi:hydrogenase expression/formation protein HypE